MADVPAAPGGAKTISLLEDRREICAWLLLKKTFRTEERLLPLIVTFVPPVSGPLLGETLLMENFNSAAETCGIEATNVKIVTAKTSNRIQGRS
jgi:hypothetical protein